MDGLNHLFSREAPSLRMLYDFACQANGHPEAWADAERQIEKRYAQDAEARDAFARLALFSAHCPILPERERDSFDRINAYGARDLDQRRLTANGRSLLATARRRMAHLLALLRTAEARTGLPLRDQWNALARALGDPAALSAPLPFLNARLKAASAFDAIILFQELVLEDAYAFASDRADPFILDGGANFGLAIACFKWRHPNARILAFEPNPSLHELCAENIRLNGWKDVDLKPWALAAEEGECRLHYSEEQPMASTLTDRLARLVPPESMREVDVPARRLGAFLTEPVDYLKLDIEGVEGEVLADAEARLSQVRQGFIEYHYDRTRLGNRLGDLLNLLEQGGFDYRIVQPPAERQVDSPAWSLLAARAWSANIYFQAHNSA